MEVGGEGDYIPIASVSSRVIYNPAFHDGRHALLLVCHAYVTCVGVLYPF